MVVATPSLLIAHDGPISVYYAPFEWVSDVAKFLLVGSKRPVKAS